MQKYVFKKYDPEYSELFTLEKKKLINALGSKLIIEHVGSTAVPDLSGKGILDIMIGILNGDLNKYKDILEKIGYEFREIASYPERLFFRRDFSNKNIAQRVHIHLVKYNGPDWRETVGFRDYLLKHPDAVKKYGEIKKKAVKIANGDGKKYKTYKEPFIKNTLKEILG